MEDRERIRRRVRTGPIGYVPPVVERMTSAAREEALGRTMTDEAAAGVARRRYRQRGLEPLEPDDRVRGLLGPDERVLAYRHAVALDPRQPAADASPEVQPVGDLYVTSERLLYLGCGMRTFDLDDIEEAALSGERILLSLHDGLGVTVDADGPRLLRVQISTARAARAGAAKRARSLGQSSSR